MSKSKHDGLSAGIRLVLIGFALLHATPALVQNYDHCGVLYAGARITDNGDGDGFADTNEILQIEIALQARCSIDLSDQVLTNCTAWLSTESPAIGCTRVSEISFGDLPQTGPVMYSPDPFEINIGDIDRHDLGLGPDDPLEAALSVDVRCVHDGIDRWAHGEIRLPLDLNVLDLGQTPGSWSEDFEDGGINPSDPLEGTAFYAQNLDAGLPGNDNSEGLANSDGWRCQYADPDWHNAQVYNHADGEVCYPAMNLSHANAIFWKLDGSMIPDTPDGGRAHRGEQSLHYGIFVGQADEHFTTPLSTVESVATRDPINLGASNPQLSFWHQASMSDYRACCQDQFQNVDRGVVQIQLHDADGVAVSPWMVLQPIKNTYAHQAETNYFNCTFDPTDDGNTEDDFFDPTDPDREYGPSSTCFPGFNWSFQGSTTGVFSTQDTGNATTSPVASDAPSLGLGTWVETKVDLYEFRGRRAKLRFLVTSIKGTAETHLAQFGPDRDERDDGWWIDDIVVDETLAEPAAVVNDLFLLGSCSGNGQACIGQCRASLAPCSDAVPCGAGDGDCVSPCPPGEVCSGPPPGCGDNCSEAQANLFVEPDGPLNPDSVTRVDGTPYLTVNFAAGPDAGTGAEPSWVDVCIDGHKEYRACVSGDPDGDLSGLPDADCDDPWDSPVCDTCSLDWSRDSMMVASQDVVTTFAVEVCCSSARECRNGRRIEIDVSCGFGQPNTFGLREIRALSKESLTWRGPLTVDWLRGSFVTGEDIGDYLADLTDTASAVTSIPMDGDPPAGTGYYYLVKGDGTASSSNLYYCGTTTWRSGGGAELLEPARNDAFGDP